MALALHIGVGTWHMHLRTYTYVHTYSTASLHFSAETESYKAEIIHYSRHKINCACTELNILSSSDKWLKKLIIAVHNLAMPTSSAQELQHAMHPLTMNNTSCDCLPMWDSLQRAAGNSFYNSLACSLSCQKLVGQPCIRFD